MSSLSKRMQALVRPNIASLEPYDPGFTSCKINLSANENTFGMPSSVRRAIRHACDAAPLNRYPDPMANTLRDSIARWYGVNRSNVCVGNGGDELIFNFFLAFGGPGKVLINCPPTFSVYDIYAKMLGCTIQNCMRDADSFEVDVDALCTMAAHADMLIVTSPNNPTGNLLSRKDVARLCEACPGMVMIDEAYIEFADPSARCDMLLASYDNLIVLHTLSKAYGAAGLRLGYILAASDVIDVFAAVRQPYTVDVLAQATAQVIVEKRAEFQAGIDAIRRERDWLYEQLDSLNTVEVWPSAANFLLVRVPKASTIYQGLISGYSILVRNFSDSYGLNDCLRITVGTHEENERLISALSELISARIKED